MEAGKDKVTRTEYEEGAQTNGRRAQPCLCAHRISKRDRGESVQLSVSSPSVRRRHCSSAGVFRHVRQNDVPCRSACCPNPLLCKAFLCTGSRKKTRHSKRTKGQNSRTADPKFVRVVRRMHSQRWDRRKFRGVPPFQAFQAFSATTVGDTTKATRRHDSHHHAGTPDSFGNLRSQVTSASPESHFALYTLLRA